MGYDEAIDYLYGLQKHGIKLGLQTPRTLLSGFGNPQEGFGSVHIAGTNGKGTTAAALASILKEAGHRVGLFTSPHMLSFTERISVDGRPISEAEVAALAGEVRGKAAGLNPTFFEVVTVMGFLHFRRAGVEWAVIEAGLGGRLDSTNVLAPRATIITTIGMDHMEFLGNTPEEIAKEKAGIIKPGVPVVTCSHPPGVMDVIRKTASDLSAPLFAEGEDFGLTVRDHRAGSVRFDYFRGGRVIEGLSLSLGGRHQALNASLAIRASELILGGEEGGQAIRRGLSSLSWPGRMELVPGDPPVLLDGAHNPGAAKALASALMDDYIGSDAERPVLLFGAMADKDYRGMLEHLLPVCSAVVFAQPAYGRAARPEELLRAAGTMGVPAKTAGSVKEGIRTAKALAGGSFVLVTGSFYLVGEAKEALGFRVSLADLGERQALR